jgi:SET domain-containing protein
MCVDATVAGNMAHLLNHSCAPSCYSRPITIAGAATGEMEDHVIIFAGR